MILALVTLKVHNYPLCHQMRKYNNGKYGGKSQGNKYLKNVCPVTKYKLSMK